MKSKRCEVKAGHWRLENINNRRHLLEHLWDYFSEHSFIILVLQSTVSWHYRPMTNGTFSNWNRYQGLKLRNICSDSPHMHVNCILLVYKALNGLAPKYIKELLVPYKPRRHLRSEAKGLLDEPRTRLKFGDRAFSINAPRLWNALPQHLKECWLTRDNIAYMHTTYCTRINY